MRGQVPMSFVTWMQPRDHQAAARTVSTLCGVAVAVTVVLAPIAPQRSALGPVPIALAVALVALVALMSVLARVFVAANRLSWAACPLFAVAALVAIDLLTQDASVSAQIFFLFPALYGASLLSRPGAVVMTAASFAGEIVVVGVQLPVREALTDAGYVGAALVTTAVLLARGGQRQADLVTSLERQAAVDPLTGLVTRRVLDEAAASALSGAVSDEGTSLILLDVDRFKSVNDRYGHPGGDRVLVQLAKLLERRSGPGDVVCRMGGDEIALLMPGCSTHVALRRAEEIVLAVRRHTFSLDDDGIAEISVSAGVAHAPTDADSLRTLYAAADAALYRAKHSGRDRVVALPSSV
jgi:diguanylate cyclase (GGDEF)-like protein